MTKWQVDEIVGHQNGKLVQPQVEKMQVGEVLSWQKWQVAEMTSWLNFESPKWKVGTATSRKKCKLGKC